MRKPRVKVRTKKKKPEKKIVIGTSPKLVGGALLRIGDRAGRRRWQGWRDDAPEENGPVTTRKIGDEK